MAIKREANYWALANILIDPKKLVAIGTYALWASEAAYKAGEPAMTSIQVQTSYAPTDGVGALGQLLENVAVNGPLSGGIAIPVSP